MRIDLEQAMAVLRADLDREWGELDFSYSTRTDAQGQPYINISALLTLHNHDDDITVIVEVYSAGLACVRAVFDQIPDTAAVMYLLNSFNAQSLGFRAYRRDDGYLELSHDLHCKQPADLHSYASDMLYHLSTLADDALLQRLTGITSAPPS